MTWTCHHCQMKYDKLVKGCNAVCVNETWYCSKCARFAWADGRYKLLVKESKRAVLVEEE